MKIQKPRINSEDFPKDLILLKKTLFDKYDFKMTELVLELESVAYGACRFKLNNLDILYRSAKITPTKTGQFVTLWKRIKKGPIQPFNNTDPIDFFIISVRKDTLFGQFIFPMPILIEKGIITYNKKEGKRAIRVYPPWDVTTSKQAQKTQKWQLNYFLEINDNNSFDYEQANQLILQQAN